MHEAARSVAAALRIACVALVSACATIPPPVVVPVVSWEEKLGWMMRLEDQRLVRDPSPPAPVLLRAATERLPPVVGPLPPSDLIRLLGDDEPRVRRRAALALGRVGAPAAVLPLADLLDDPDVEVSQMAAFALGLIGDEVARPALLAALVEPDPVLQGRAAEALGRIGDRADAPAVGAMLYAHVLSGALEGIGPDELGYPLSAPVEAIRLGAYALADLRAYDQLAGAVLDSQGLPVSRWWPIAYALQRVGDPRALPTLLTLLETPGRYTAAFALRGIAAARSPATSDRLRAIVTGRGADTAVVIQAIRALAAIGDRASVPVFTEMMSDRAVTGALRIEAVSALMTLVDESHVDLLLELVTDPTPTTRRDALTALARVEPQTFVTALAALEPDRDWSVRAAVAAALATLPGTQGLPRLALMLQDQDTRVLPAVISAVATVDAPAARDLLLDRLGSDDFMVRATAAGLLADAKVVAAVPQLVNAYQNAVGDSTYVARAAILRALTRLDPAAARPLLDEALADREWAVRIHAAALRAELGLGTEDGDAAILPAASSRPADAPEWQALANPPFSPHAFIETHVGTIEIELAVLDAPLTVANFVALARKGFFNGLAIHRVVPDFVVQDGDPRGDGQGGPGYTIRDEVNQRPYLRGTVGMALDWEDTGGSQFFITHSPQPHLDGTYTVFGHVVSGMEVVDGLLPGDVVQRVRIWDGVSPD
jgi:cyclophilin family peptidyl-prolyl cis-trans isomerase/HEAT repeat protein